MKNEQDIACQSKKHPLFSLTEHATLTMKKEELHIQKGETYETAEYHRCKRFF